MFTTRSLSKVAKVAVGVRMNSGIKRVGVVGLGLMGHGVAQIAAQAGFQVLAIENNQKSLDNGVKSIQDSLSKVIAKDVKKGKFASEADGKKKFDEVMGNIKSTINIADAKDCDVIIEAIVENEPIKIDFYKKLGPLIKPECIFASNTSSLPITAMAEASGRPKNFVGLHFFNPVQIMQLVEVIRSKHTDDAVFDRMTQFGKDIGKTTVTAKDTPGFIVNRLLIPYLNSAMHMVDRGDASIPDIDISMVLGSGHPMGPIHLADYVGLDTCYNVLKGWHAAHPNDSAFFIPKCLEELVNKGELGRKTGKGFYHWDGQKRGDVVPRN